MSLSIYPRIYCPAGVILPTCCAHRGAVGTLPGHGPDAKVAADGTRTGGGGLTYGPQPWRPTDTTWQRTAAGWWIDLDGHRPQDLLRLDPHHRILRWRTVYGVTHDQCWRIPVLVTSAGGSAGPDPAQGYLSAIDRVLSNEGWSAGDLADLQTPLLAIASGIPLHQDPDARNAEILRLTIALLTVGHWVDRDLLIHTGWLTEALQLSVIMAALDQDPTQTHQDLQEHA